MPKPFHYSVIKLVPHPIREEAVNLGVVLISESGEYGDFRLTRAYRSKLRALAPDVHPTTVQRFIEDFQLRFPKVGKTLALLEGDHIIASVEKLAELASHHSTQFRFTPPRPVLTDDPQRTLTQLFEEFVAPIRLSWEARVDRQTVKSWLLRMLREFRVPNAAIVDHPRIPVRHGFNTLNVGIRRTRRDNGNLAAALEPISFALPGREEIVRHRDHVAWVAYDSSSLRGETIIGAVVTEPLASNRSLFEESLEIFRDVDVAVARFDELGPLRDLLARAGFTNLEA